MGRDSLHGNLVANDYRSSMRVVPLLLALAYRRALRFTGKVAVQVGVTLAAGVATWALSPIEFQADRGILLAFVFVWNMLGVVLLIPELSPC